MSPVCRRCGKSLENTESIQNGMGPVCYAKTHQHENTETLNLVIQENLSQFFPRELDPEIARLFYEKLTIKTCKHCHIPLPDKIMHYEHDGGWDVPGFVEKQWLFITCPKCQNQWSLWKLGVPR